MEDKKLDIPKLQFIDSNHEQREMSVKFIPVVGGWLEEGKFWEAIEKFDIHNRWRCYDKVKTDNKIVVKLKLMDHKQQQKRANKLARQVVDKNKEILTASLMKTVIKGVVLNEDGIEKFVQNAKLIDDNEARAKLDYKLKLQKRIKKRKESIEKNKQKIIDEEETLKDLEEEKLEW